MDVLFLDFLLVTVESSPIRLENPSNIAENLPAWLPATTIWIFDLLANFGTNRWK